MKVIAGDWPENSNVAIKRSITGKIQSMMIQKGVFSFDYVKLEDIRSAELITADNHMSVGSKLGWGIGGALVLGPLGAVIGAVAAGNVKEQVVAIQFNDGRKIIIRGKKKDMEPILAAAYKWES